MATTKQKEAAKKNIGKARDIQSARAHGAKIPKQSPGLSTSAKNKMPDNVYAFPKERKEPLTDAKHVRNAIARFDQVEGVTDKEKDAAWKRIMKAAKDCDVEISESSWRELGQPGKTQSSKSPSSRKTTASKASTASKTRPTSKTSSISKPSAASKTRSISKPSAASKIRSISKPPSAKKTTSARKTTSASKPAAAKK